MNEPRFVKRVSSTNVPKEPVGRLIRVTFDLDVDAIYDYVMFDAKMSTDPWTYRVMNEIHDVLGAEFRDIGATMQAFAKAPTHD